MTTWVLIVWFWASGSPNATPTIGGFTSRENCEMAGTIWDDNYGGNGRGSINGRKAYICLPVK